MASRYGSMAGPPSVVRKSRMDGKMSLLPKPRRPGSVDRPSIDAKRPSAVNYRSSSTEPPRATFGGRLSREASATKIPINSRSRSQTSGGEVKYEKTTPLRSSQYSRNYNTPNRTPSKERGKIDLQAALDRVLAFYTVKDQRPINNIAWQRSECARINEVLISQELGGLNRPLTIARFVEIVNELITQLLRDPKLNNDTYVTKMPNLVKRLLYPGIVSKSWLRTVNTLHAFPHALALISYLTDMLCDLRRPFTDECLYKHNDKVSCFRREFLKEGWRMFNLDIQSVEVNDHIQSYVDQFKELVGFDEQKVLELQEINKEHKTRLEESEAEVSALREKEEALSCRIAHIRSEIKAVRNDRRNLADTMTSELTRTNDLSDGKKQLAAEIERLKPQQAQLQGELAAQTMSVQQRDGLLDKLDFNRRVVDTKWALAEDISRKLINKENELALWQKLALESCAQYKQGLIHLTPVCPHLASLAVDESEVMSEQCIQMMARAVEELQREQTVLADRRSQRARSKTQLHRRNAQMAEETRSKISEVKMSIDREQQVLEEEMASDAASAAAWSREEAEFEQRTEEMKAELMRYQEIEDQLKQMQEQHHLLKERVAYLKSVADAARTHADKVLERSRIRHERLLRDAIDKVRERIRKDFQ
ncbi:myosin heavy chain, embryonic smooth muscle isoform [Pieris napi]|uniref:myosin heavy chain, embryonic smooth muscle isoform n=1 Tax=Pieris napi TaxID=78633 RepID=UPI001FB8A5CD|nr:myosin heavy chain, embryonic smooth muscle isoform [Pieris napi]